MIAASESAAKNSHPRLVSAAIFAMAVLLCTFAFSFLSAGAAQAHALHPSEAAQLQELGDPQEFSGEPRSGDAKTLTEGECGVGCCSTAHCAFDLVRGSAPVAMIGGLSDAFVSLAVNQAAPAEKGSLKRPPRS